MGLPKNFQISQGSLQDFNDCPRRFQLKYLECLSWPAIETEPALENERYIQQGANFHQLLQQYFLGLSVSDLNSFAEKENNLNNWWNSFLRLIQNNDWDLNKPENYHYPEISFSIPLQEYRLVGKFDLLVISGENYFIFDWKTSRNKPNRERYRKYLQTKVYPFLLVKSGLKAHTNEAIRPSRVKMIYWFANFPTIALSFHYSAQQFKEDTEYFEKLLVEIGKLDKTPAKKTQNVDFCKFCIYRSLCNRGVEAGLLDERIYDEVLVEDIDINFEQITEIEF